MKKLISIFVIMLALSQGAKAQQAIQFTNNSPYDVYVTMWATDGSANCNYYKSTSFVIPAFTFSPIGVADPCAFQSAYVFNGPDPWLIPAPVLGVPFNICLAIPSGFQWTELQFDYITYCTGTYSDFLGCPSSCSGYSNTNSSSAPCYLSGNCSWTILGSGVYDVVFN